MKAKYGILVLSVLLALAACTNGDDNVVETQDFVSLPAIASPELSAIDSLMWEQPDSALSVLMDYLSCRDVSRNVSTNAYENHYAQLLAAELLYKNDYAQTNRAELQQAVAYFDTLLADTRDVSLHKIARRDASHASAPNDDLVFLAARAHYINGVGYYEQDSVVQACKEYLTALETMENHFEEMELVGKRAKFMALTYTHLTGLFSDQYLHEQAVFFGKLSLRYYDKYNAQPRHVAWMLNEIGSQYDMMNKSDTSIVFYNKGLEILPDTNSITYRDLAVRIAYLSYKKGESNEIVLRQLYNLINQSGSINERLSRHAILGEIFYHDALFDSARVHLEKVFHESQSIALKKQSAEWLVDICKSTGRDSDILEYANFLVPFANLEENQSDLKSQLTEYYKDYEKKKAEIKYKKQEKKNQNATNRAISLLLLGMAVIALLYLANKKRHRRLQSQHKETEKLLESEQQVHRFEQAALSGRLKRSNQEVHELKDQLLKQKKDTTIPSERPETFTDEPICQLILKRVNEGNFLSQMDCTIYKDYALGKEQLMALREAADRHYNRFTIRLSKAYPELTKSDIDYCCLYLLGLSDADVAALMQRAYNTINERNKKLRKILGTDNAVSSVLLGFAQEYISF